MPPEDTGAHPDFPTEAQIRVWGELAFLAMRCPRHAGMTAAQLREAFEPAVVTGQYRIFRFDGIGRAALTFGLLSYEAERRYLAGEVLSRADWRSGRQLWILDLMAPYPGLAAVVARWVMTPGNLTRRNFYYRRVADAGTTRRIVHVDFEAPGRRGRLVPVSDFDIDTDAAGSGR